MSRTRLVATMLLLASVALASACNSDDTKGTSTQVARGTTPAVATTTPAIPTPIPTVEGVPTVTASGLQIIDTKVGDGAEAKPTDTVTVNYTGYLQDGTVFDASAKHGGPAQFPLSGVIPGWTEGVSGMKVGGSRRLIIPPDLAYGSRASAAIPANSTLTFDIELVSIP